MQRQQCACQTPFFALHRPDSGASQQKARGWRRLTFQKKETYVITDFSSGRALIMSFASSICKVGLGMPPHAGVRVCTVSFGELKWAHVLWPESSRI